LRDGVEGHQVRKLELHFLRSEADDAQVSSMAEKRESRRLARRRPRGLEDCLPPGRDGVRLRQPTNGRLEVLCVELMGSESELGAAAGERLEAREVDVAGDDVSSESRRDLDAESADPSGPYEDREIAGFETAARDHLVGCRHRVGDDR
jgi:hypothetical protein